MRTIIATDTKFYVEGNDIWASEKMAQIIPRYYLAFGKIVLIARRFKDKPNAKLTNISGMVENQLLFLNFKELHSMRFRSLFSNQIAQSDLVIGRFEGFSAILSYDLAKKYNVPFFGEVMSDPWDGLWNHSLLGKIIAPYAYIKTKQAMRNAKFGLYVTDKYLQNRYPCPNQTVAVSNVFIEEIEDSILDKRLEKIQSMDLSCIKLMTTAAVYVKYKGQKYVIESIPKLNKQGIRIQYYLVGEGDQTYLRKIAERNHVEDQVFFLGRLEPSEVLQQLDKIDFYVQPSLQEGLPRSVIEAMSRGCPCLGARTAGIPELLSERSVFERASVDAVFESVLAFRNKELLKEEAMTNFRNSKKYLNDELSQIRNNYFSYVKSKL